MNQPAQPTQPRITLGEIAFDSAHWSVTRRSGRSSSGAT